MKIYALNGMQSHSEYVKNNVSFHEQVVLKGFLIDGTIQLLEGSHRMAYAIELGIPVIIVLFGEDEIIPNDCDVKSMTGHLDRCTVRELANDLLNERGLYNQAVYESNDYSNITIVNASDGNGKLTYFKLLCTLNNNSSIDELSILENAAANPCSAFHQKLQLIVLYSLGSKVLVVGNNENRPAVSFAKLGADVTYIDLSNEKLAYTVEFAKNKNLYMKTDVFQDFKLSAHKDELYDLIYAADICNHAKNLQELYELFENYRRLLKTGGLLVTLDKHPFINIFDVTQLSEGNICRSYDDLKHKNEIKKTYWRIEDIMRGFFKSGLRLNTFMELQTGYDLYDKGWYSSVEERLRDADKLSDFKYNPLAAVPQWLATFSNK